MDEKMDLLELKLDSLRNSRIIVHVAEPEVAKFAAEELRDHLREATGVDIQITYRSSESGFEFIVGEVSAKLAGVGMDGIKHDGFLIHFGENNLTISGTNPRGTLNGVYEFLRGLGFNWIFPRKSEMITPNLDVLRISRDSRIVNPGLELRGVCVFPVNRANIANLRKIIDWMGENGFNLLMTSVHRAKKRESGWEVEWRSVEDELLPELRKRGIILNMSEHAGRYFFPTAYFEEHPEWFAMNKEGERYSTGQICYSNDEAVAKLAENYVEYVKSHPEIDIVGTWPEDGYGFCQCDGCARSGVVLEAVNEIAERIENVRPDLTVEYLSYTEETSIVPEDVLPRSNMSILVANTRVAREWKRKSDAVGGRGVYQLHYGIADNTAMRANLPLRIAATHADCETAKEIGSRGIIPFYIGIDTWWRSSLNLHFLSRFSWDSELTPKKALCEFCRAYYRSSADEMTEVFEMIEKMPPVNLDMPPPWPLWQEWSELKATFTGVEWEGTLEYFRELRGKLDSARENAGNSVSLRGFDAVDAYIAFHETMHAAWSERALAVIAFEANDAESVRRRILAVAQYENELIGLLRRSVEIDDGVNGAYCDFDFFQNWRLQLDKQLLEMRTEKEKKPFMDENPDVEMFLPGLLMSE